MAQRRILKYSLNLMGETVLELPSGAEVLDAANQRGRLVIWAGVDEDEPLEEVKFQSATTGGKCPKTEEYDYINTVILGSHVTHVFIEIGEDEDTK